ncbi:MAG: hypothetical protein V4654_00195 [Bdellovibrionota bacterium]
MKSLAMVLFVLGMGQVSFAAQELQCADQAVKTATMKNFKRFGASTGSCGAKLLTAGAYSETYLVCVSDETDPSEWVIVMKKANKGCHVKYADTQHDSETPNFESSEGLLKTVECSIDHADNAKLICK